MSDMRLIVAGAGGRMGRTLIKAIAEIVLKVSRKRSPRLRLKHFDDLCGLENLFYCDTERFSNSCILFLLQVFQMMLDDSFDDRSFQSARPSP